MKFLVTAITLTVHREVDMSVFLANLADRVFSKLTPALNQREQERGALLYHDDGSVSLNLANKDVQKRITQQLEVLAQFKIENHNDQPHRSDDEDC